MAKKLIIPTIYILKKVNIYILVLTFKNGQNNHNFDNRLFMGVNPDRNSIPGWFLKQMLSYNNDLSSV